MKRNLLLLKIFFVQLLCFSINLTTSAATITWDGGGGDNNWTTATNWSGDVVPGTGDDVVFDATSAKNCTINANVSIRSINIAAAYTGAVNQGAQTMTLSVSLTIASSYSGGTGTVIFSNSNSFSCNSTASLNNLEINLAGSDGDLSVSGTLTVDNNLLITDISDLTGTIQVLGNITSNTTDFRNNGIIEAAKNGNQQLSGSGIIANLKVSTTNGNLILMNDFNLDGFNSCSLTGTGNITANSGSEKLIFNRDGATSVNFSGTVQNLELNLPGSSGDLTITGTLTVDNDLLITDIDQLTGTVQVLGNITSNTTFMRGDGIIEAAKNGNQQLSGSGLIANLKVSTTNGNLILMNDFNLDGFTHCSLTGTGNITANSGSEKLIFKRTDLTTTNFSGTVQNLELNLAGSGGDLTITGILTVDNDLLITDIDELAGTIQVLGNISSTNTFMRGTGIIEAAKNGNQQLSGSGIIANLKVSTTNGNLILMNDFNLDGFTHCSLTGTGNITANSGSEKLIFKRTGAITTNFSGTIQNMEINNAAADLNITGTLTVAEDLLITAFDDLIGTINVTGDITVNDAEVSGGTVVMTGSSTNTFTGTGGGSFSTLAIEKTASTDNSQLKSSETFTSIEVREGIFDIEANTATAGTTVQSGGTLKGTGSIVGTFTINSGGIVAPGGSVGTLNTTGAVQIDGTAQIEVTNPSTFDVINSTNSSSLNIGSATIQFVFSGTANDYNNGNKFQVFTGFAANSDNPTITNNLGFTMAYNGNGEFEITAGALPVELIELSAIEYENQVKVKWTTVSEFNNEGFEIEHSLDNRTWETIGFVSGEGTTFEKQSYSFLHKNPAHGINYYRLKQMDFDGAFAYSDIISADLTNFENLSNLRITPNPVQTGQVTLYIPETDFEEANLEIYNSTGILVQTERLYSNQMTIQTSDLPKGIYLFSIKINGQIMIEKVVIR